jgi:hypothetical protein
MENDTWEVMSLPTNQKAIKYRWIFSIKPGYKDTTRRKAGKVYTQNKGKDYEETYAPIVKS